MPLQLSQLKTTEIHRLSPDQTVFFFPVGPVEDHGPHLPVGLDGMEATRLCEIAADRLEREMPGWTGVIMPVAPLGIEGNTTQFVIRVRAHVLRDWLVDACRSLARSGGFRHFVCFSGHLGPRTLTAIEEAGKIVSRSWFGSLSLRLARGAKRKTTLISASSALVSAAEVRRSPLWLNPNEHGGAIDTAIALSSDPNEVDLGFVDLPPIEPPARHWLSLLSPRKEGISGYWGHPAKSVGLDGSSVLRERVDRIFPKLRAVWEGANPNHLFRSWYSIFPPNQSFFKAWLLALLWATIMVAWIFFNMESLMG